MISQKVRKLVEARDPACWHCAKTDGLQIHHRRNRGLGGVRGKAAEVSNSPQNLIRVCADYNYLMESNATIAAQSRGWGHKLPMWGDLEMPVFDCTRFTWYVLDTDGGKVEVSFQDTAF
jgi:hypothetical protein